ncbi:hypothetical protein MC7420_4000 [Coleofasciculus chthonoplastes PCC 7420]|uniref:Uncharacterized protein n=1 Tax=Coleofasciculus chthonoplastes PCC 7420 TaxID=118168 RepID=B4VUD9_9CYAN|nr:hypothetical protein MC7420_4000 [Coleofasciculus chthonoplastes PCC 7420]
MGKSDQPGNAQVIKRVLLPTSIFCIPSPLHLITPSLVN